MKRVHVWMMMPLTLLSGTGTVRAQLVGPIPSATAPTPEYVPPERRSVPRVEVPETAPMAPSIVRKDEQGRLRPLRGTPEQAVVAVYPFEPSQREKIAASTAARLVDLDRFVVQNLDKVLAAREMIERVGKASNFSELFAARDTTAALHFERLIDRLRRDGAITLAQRLRVDEALLAYSKARKAEIDKAAGDDPTRMAVLNLRQTFTDTTKEPFESLDRQIGALCGSRGLAAIKLRDDQRAAYAKLVAEGSGSGERSAPVSAGACREFFLGVLDLEQQRAALTAGLAARAEKP